MSNLAVFSSESLSNSGSSGWKECECIAYSGCYIFTAGERKGNVLDPVWCVDGGKKTLTCLLQSFSSEKRFL